MARKPSVILTAQERKDVQTGIKAEIAAAKGNIAETKAKQKVHETEGKALKKALEGHQKTLLGLQTRLDALKPAPKPVV